MTLNMRKLSALSYELDGNKMKIKEVVVISELLIYTHHDTVLRDNENNIE